MLTVKVTEVPGKVTATINYVDAEGNAAKVDGTPSWSVDNPDVVDAMVVASDGMSAEIHIANALGAANVTVVADADLGSGVTEITSVDTISVIPGDAVAANFTFGTVTTD